MGLATLSVVVWGVAIFSLRIAIGGNPLYALIRQTPPAVLQEAVKCFNPQEPQETDDEEVGGLIRRFSRFLFLAAAALVVEMGVCFYFISRNALDSMSWFLVGKNTIAFMIGYWLHQHIDPNPIKAIMQLPAWVARWERISYLLSAICMLILFLRIYGIG